MSGETMIRKAVLVGKVGSGKSSFFCRFKSDVFYPDMVSTIGLDSFKKTLKVNQGEVELSLWDTAGLEVAGYMTGNYYHHSQAIILLFDLTNSLSLDEVKVWYEDAATYVDKSTQYFLVGNKTDCSSAMIEVSDEVMYSVAESLSIPRTNVFKLSVKKGGKEFNDFIMALAQQVIAQQFPPSNNITIQQAAEVKKREHGCCVFR